MAAATVAVAALTAPGGGGGCSPRQGAAPLAAWLSSLLLAAALGLCDPGFSCGSIHTSRTLCGEWDRNEASLQLFIHRGDQQCRYCYLELSTRGIYYYFVVLLLFPWQIISWEGYTI